MNYITNQTLPIQSFSSADEMYPERETRDICAARYMEHCGIKSDPNICALPGVFSPEQLIREANTVPYGYSQNVHTLPPSERLGMLYRFPDCFRAYMPSQREFEFMMDQCLISAYEHRRYGIVDSDKDPDTKICSVLGDRLSSSVQSMSLIGTSGTGKSTTARLICSKYPKAIRHNLNGLVYTQIPIIVLTAKPGFDIKSCFLDIAAEIDSIVGGDCYEKTMAKKRDRDKMSAYLCELIKTFHIGMIVIDEVQLAMRDYKNKGTLFEALLSVTSSSAVSFAIIGIEDVVPYLVESEWLMRRFGHIGRIESDVSKDDNLSMRVVIQMMWNYQYTVKQYKLTERIIDLLIKESYQNIDLLITIYVYAQYLVISGELKGKEVALDEKTIRRASKKFNSARLLLKNGEDALDSLYSEEKSEVMDHIMKDSENLRKLEMKKNAAVAAADHCEKINRHISIKSRIRGCGFDEEEFDDRTIDAVISKLERKKEFKESSLGMQARSVVAELEKNKIGDKTKPEEIEVEKSELGELQAAIAR